MIKITHPILPDFESIDIDPFWNIGSEAEHNKAFCAVYNASISDFVNLCSV